VDKVGELTLLLDEVRVGAPGRLDFRITTPTGVFPVHAQRGEDGQIGRLTVILAAAFGEAVSEGLFEPLSEVEGDELWITDAVGARLLEGADLPPLEDPLAFTTLDPACGATLLRCRVASGRAEVAWWYGGDDQREDEGITALDLVLDPACDPMEADAPVRNMESVIREFFREHGPPSLQPE